jgi:Immunity protein 35
VNRAEAIAAAERALRAMTRPDLPLRLHDPDRWSQRSWCFVFPFNSVGYLDHGRMEDLVPTGALVVPKDGSPPWVLPSALTTDEGLDMHERARDLQSGR